MAGDQTGKKEIVFAEITVPIVVMVTWHYFGPSLGMAITITAIVLYVGCRFFPLRQQFLLWPITIQGGHMLWMISDLYYGFLNPILLDIFILAGGLIWLSLRPGLWPTSLLCIYQTLALLSNVIVLFYVSLAANTHQALLVHITWRGLALLSMLAYFIFRAYAKVGNIESPEGDGERTCRDERIADRPSPEGRAAGTAAT